MSPDAAPPVPGLVTVILPLYRVWQWLPDAIASVRAQTYGAFECLCLDDGSGNGMEGRARALTAGDPRFRVLGFPNAGVAECRNRGLRLARGEFVAFIDQDDFWHPAFLATLLAALREAKADCAVCAYRPIPTRQAYAETPFPEPRLPAEAIEDPLRWALAPPKGCAALCVWQKLYRREALRGLTFANLHGADDALFTFQSFARLSRVAWVPDPPLYCYRSQPLNVSSAAPFAYTAGRLGIYPRLLPDVPPRLLGLFRRHVASAAFGVIKIARGKPYAPEEHQALARGVWEVLRVCGVRPWQWSPRRWWRYLAYRRRHAPRA